MAATLRDIAQHMGLSESTISRVLNGKGRVGPETRRRVLEYAEEINYHPNQLAKRLKLQAAESIGVVVPDISNEFYALLFKYIDQCLAPQGFTPTLFNIGEDLEREVSFMAHLRSSTVDGMIVATAGSEIYPSLSPQLLKRIVFVDNLPVGLDDCLYVGADNVKSSYDLTQHLVDRGHTRIATVMGPVRESSATERLEGFQQCLADNGIPLREEWVVRTNFQYEDGYAKAQQLLAGDEFPTAIIAQNNVLAYATIRVVRKRRLQVPGDVAVACFDHLDPYGFMRPVITTMVQPLEAIADLACELLLKSRATDSASARHLLEVQFQLGETT